MITLVFLKNTIRFIALTSAVTYNIFYLLLRDLSSLYIDLVLVIMGYYVYKNYDIISFSNLLTLLNILKKLIYNHKICLF